MEGLFAQINSIKPLKIEKLESLDVLAELQRLSDEAALPPPSTYVFGGSRNQVELMDAMLKGDTKRAGEIQDKISADLAEWWEGHMGRLLKEYGQEIVDHVEWLDEKFKQHKVNEMRWTVKDQEEEPYEDCYIYAYLRISMDKNGQFHLDVVYSDGSLFTEHKNLGQGENPKELLNQEIKPRLFDYFNA